MSQQTLAEAQQWLRDNIDQGARCPCCTQFAKVYKRKINSSMAADLIAMYRAFGMDWGYLPDLRKQASLKGNREESKLRYWGLVEEETDRRPDGGRPGVWRVTDTGAQWIIGRLVVPEYARIYDGRLLGLTGASVTIFHALGERFDYDELMAA